MRAYIHKLRSKPEDARKRILVGSLIVSMAFVGFIWIYGLGNQSKSSPADSVASSVTQPFALFGQSVSSAYQNISASVGKISFSSSGNPANQPSAQTPVNVVPDQSAQQTQ